MPSIKLPFGRVPLMRRPSKQQDSTTETRQEVVGCTDHQGADSTASARASASEIQTTSYELQVQRPSAAFCAADQEAKLSESSNTSSPTSVRSLLTTTSTPSAQIVTPQPISRSTSLFEAAAQLLHSIRRDSDRTSSIASSSGSHTDPYTDSTSTRSDRASYSYDRLEPMATNNSSLLKLQSSGNGGVKLSAAALKMQQEAASGRQNFGQSQQQGAENEARAMLDRLKKRGEETKPSPGAGTGATSSSKGINPPDTTSTTSPAPPTTTTPQKQSSAPNGSPSLPEKGTTPVQRKVTAAADAAAALTNVRQQQQTPTSGAPQGTKPSTTGTAAAGSGVKTTSAAAASPAATSAPQTPQLKQQQVQPQAQKPSTTDKPAPAAAAVAQQQKKTPEPAAPAVTVTPDEQQHQASAAAAAVNKQQPTEKAPPPAAAAAAAAPEPQTPVSDAAKFWDQQIAQGKLSMCCVKYPTYINIMLYGESGLGKTTCIRNLIGNWGIRRMGSAFAPTCKTSLEQFKKDPSSMRIELEPIADETANLEMHYSFQDMPGWGDDINLINSLKTVLHFLLKQRQRDFIFSKAGQTEFCAVPGTMMRHGITVCLYFVPPHRVKPIDWILMAAISKLVAVIPVIAKADTYTQQEMEDFRQELLRVIRHTSPISRTATPAAGAPGTSMTKISMSSGGRSSSTAPEPAGPSVGEDYDGSAADHHDALGGHVVALPIGSDELGEGDIKQSRANIKTGSSHDHVGLAQELHLETYTFRQSDLAMVGASPHKHPPFSIVSSNNLMTADEAADAGGAEAEMMPGMPFRRYRWGTAYPLNREHSDLIIMKQLLFGHRNFAVHDLLQDSWRRAHAFAKQYQTLLLRRQQQKMEQERDAAGAAGADSLAAQHLGGAPPPWGEEAVSLQPLVEELCSSTTGESNSQLIDKLQTEETRRMQALLKIAQAELERKAALELEMQTRMNQLQAEADSLKSKVVDQAAVIERLQMSSVPETKTAGTTLGNPSKTKSKLFR